MGIINQLAGLTQNYGVYGLGLGMFLESLGIPFASALVTITAGTLIATGQTTFWQALFITTAGLILGSTVSYYIGYWGGSLSRFFPRLSRKKKPSRLFMSLQGWGEFSIILAQLFGTTRTWVSIPAGAMRMKLEKFILFTAIGGTIYCALAIGLSAAITGLIAHIWKMFRPEFLLLIFVLTSAVLYAIISIRRKRREQKNKELSREKIPAE